MNSHYHRRHKRELEAQISVKEICYYIKNNDIREKPLTILEFGCGEGLQQPYLSKLGDVIATDIIPQPKLMKSDDVDFKLSDIMNTQFSRNTFDIIYSNHVLEHIENISLGFRELKNIGAEKCLYAFAVPTNIWLLLSIPAQYYNRIRKVIQLYLTRKISRQKNEKDNKNTRMKTNYFQRPLLAWVYRKLIPQGHGVITNFTSCYSYFRILSWRRLFVNNGFSILKTVPLLIYGPSEFPIIKTKKSNTKFCSSVLFLLKVNRGSNS